MPPKKARTRSITADKRERIRKAQVKFRAKQRESQKTETLIEKTKRLQVARDRVRKCRAKQSEEKRLHHQNRNKEYRRKVWAPKNRDKIKNYQEKYVGRKKNEAASRKGISLL